MRARLWSSLCGAFLALLLPSFSAPGEEILLYPGQQLSLGEDITLVIEDADSQREVVWLNLSQKSQSLNSSLVHKGEHLLWRDYDISVLGIYAGDVGDLVVLQINNTYELMPVSAEVVPGSRG
jgi:hypothetical protein